MTPNSLTPAQVELVLKSLPDHEKAALLTMMHELEKRKRVAICQNDFLAFIAAMDGTYKFGSHLKKLGSLLMDVERGIKDRVAVSIPPRFGKSQMISIYYPAWYLGRHPDHKVIVASHTVDLAVVMSRKVRNLMQTAEYKEVFPDTRIAIDAKAAGQWNTTAGGEYFAIGVGGALAGRGANLCLSQKSVVETKTRGFVQCATVQVGESLRSWHGWAKVLKRITPEHAATVTVAGKLRVSIEHPIWTCNRGWVDAVAVRATDILWTTSFYDKLGAYLQGASHGEKVQARNVQYAGLQHLGDDAPAMHKPESGQLHKLWGCWGYGRRAVERLRDFLPRHGVATYAGAYAGPDRQCAGVFSGQLPVGRHGDATEQPDQWGPHNSLRGDAIGPTVVAAHGVDQGHDTTPCVCHGDDAGGSAAGPSNEPQHASYHPIQLGWVRRAGVCLLSRCGQIGDPYGIREDKKGYLGSAGSWGQSLLGVLLGVRFAGVVRVEHHEARPFVNFMVDGDNTFVADTVLTHNCIVDDPISEQDVKAGNTTSLDGIYEWYSAGLRTRLMPGGAIVALHTRWSLRDLIGRLIKDSELNVGGDKYEVFEFPAILNENTPDEKSLWPEQWTIESLQQTRASMHHIMWQWHAQYQQNPTASEAAIIKREWIKWWPHVEPPRVDFIVQAWDTALTTKQRSDFSVGQTWGVWTTEDGDTNAILLNQVRGKYEFPELKKIAHQQFEEWQPDSVIVEAKASGQPLIDEMRRSGIFVQDYSPGKGQDKIARINSVSDMFATGHVWFPETSWASVVVEELLAFPAGEHDDCVDGCSLALIRIRQGGLLTQRNDIRDNGDFVPRKQGGYY